MCTHLLPLTQPTYEQTTIHIHSMVNLELPIDLTPCMSLDCGRKLERTPADTGGNAISSTDHRNTLPSINDCVMNIFIFP